MQATLQPLSRHKYSLDFYRSGDYKLWERDLDGSDYEIERLFLWIVGKAEHTHVSQYYPSTTAKTGNVPAYTEHVMAFQAVHKELDFL